MLATLITRFPWRIRDIRLIRRARVQVPFRILRSRNEDPRSCQPKRIDGGTGFHARNRVGCSLAGTEITPGTQPGSKDFPRMQLLEKPAERQNIHRAKAIGSVSEVDTNHLIHHHARLHTQIH